MAKEKPDEAPPGQGGAANTQTGAAPAGDSAQPANAEVVNRAVNVIGAAADGRPAGAGPAPPAPAGNSAQQADAEVVNRAVNVIGAANVQRKNILEAFELQKATIAHGIRTRREAAIEEMAHGRETVREEGAQNMNNPQAYGTAPQYGGMPSGAPLTANQLIAQEFASTIRSMIAEEVDRQLKVLLSVYTNNQAQQAEGAASDTPAGPDQTQAAG